MISVVIPNYNRRELLAACLGSLRAQTYRDFEVVVVDNGSTDGSAEMVGRDFPEAKVVRLETNAGFSGAVNRGIDACGGDFVALLNNDAEADPAWLEELSRAASLHPDAGSFASKMLLFYLRDMIDTVADGFSVAGFGYKRGWGDMDRGQYDGLGYVFGACGGAAMYRREMLDSIKLGRQYFDEDYFAYGEDLDLSFRAQARGYRCVSVPSAKVYHRFRATGGVSSSMPIYLGNRNCMVTLLTNFPRSVLIKHSPSIAAFWLLSVVTDFAKTGRFTVLKAYLDALRGMDGIRAKRAAKESLRTISDSEFDALLDRNWLSIWAGTGIRSHRMRKALATLAVDEGPGKTTKEKI